MLLHLLKATLVGGECTERLLAVPLGVERARLISMGRTAAVETECRMLPHSRVSSSHAKLVHMQLQTYTH